MKFSIALLTAAVALVSAAPAHHEHQGKAKVASATSSCSSKGALPTPVPAEGKTSGAGAGHNWAVGGGKKNMGGQNWDTTGNQGAGDQSTTVTTPTPTGSGATDASGTVPPPVASAVCVPNTTTDPTTGKKTYNVCVGGLDILRYDPAFVRVEPGNDVKFHFLAKNHTVSESTFDAPCTFKEGGLDSGFQPNLDNKADGPTFVVEVKDTKPQWFYCKQGNHCKLGMVFAINPEKAANPPPVAPAVDSAKTYIKFLTNAITTFCAAPPAGGATPPATGATPPATGSGTPTVDSPTPSASGDKAASSTAVVPPVESATTGGNGDKKTPTGTETTGSKSTY